MAYISALDEFLRSEQDFWPGLRIFLNATFSLTTEKSGYGIWDMGYGRMENVSFSLPLQGIFGQYYILGMGAICHEIANSLNMLLMLLNIVTMFAS